MVTWCTWHTWPFWPGLKGGDVRFRSILPADGEAVRFFRHQLAALVIHLPGATPDWWLPYGNVVWQEFDVIYLQQFLWCSMMFYDVLWCSMMLYDVLWCSMMFYDVLWCSMMFYDVLWCSMMLYDALWCSMMFYDVLWCSMMFYDVLCCSMMFYDVLWCSMMFYDVLWCSMMFYDVLWCSMMFYDVLWCSMMFYDVLWCSMMFYDVLWCSMMFYDVLWCSMMIYDVLWSYSDISKNMSDRISANYDGHWSSLVLTGPHKFKKQLQQPQNHYSLASPDHEIGTKIIHLWSSKSSFLDLGSASLVVSRRFPGLHRISHREFAGDLFDLLGLHIAGRARAEPAQGVAAVRVGRLDDAGATKAVRAHGLATRVLKTGMVRMTIIDQSWWYPLVMSK